MEFTFPRPVRVSRLDMRGNKERSNDATLRGDVRAPTEWCSGRGAGGACRPPSPAIAIATATIAIAIATAIAIAPRTATATRRRHRYPPPPTGEARHALGLTARMRIDRSLQ